MVPARECQVFDVPVIYIWDVVSWIYQHSKHAAEESSTLSLIGKYWIGLTRFMQNPLSEHAALSAHITAISFGDENQHLLLIALERVLVDMTNKVSVEINRMVMDSYYQHLLPLVCVLGPRKVNTLVRKIATLGGILVNRGHFIKSGLLTTKIFLNEDGPDPLDATCIHLEDYELA
ncbi:helix-hairpin-helix motif-domain-containing protein [Pisolithus microcarpus]|nr:helix-hairpin-helix motif-domain-containing protein [Pisolithus microcarpus]